MRDVFRLRGGSRNAAYRRGDCGGGAVTNDTLAAAIAEAERFLKAAKKVTPEEIAKDGYRPSVTIAATKRASMDLTRALAQLRKRS